MYFADVSDLTFDLCGMYDIQVRQPIDYISGSDGFDLRNESVVYSVQLL